jgi:tryptophan synthase alpha chain
VVNDVQKHVSEIKKATPLPVVVGFGVKSGEQAHALGRAADGVVVGSAIVSRIEKSLGAKGEATPKTTKDVLELVKELSSALRAD